MDSIFERLFYWLDFVDFEKYFFYYCIFGLGFIMWYVIKIVKYKFRGGS